MAYPGNLSLIGRTVEETRLWNDNNSEELASKDDKECDGEIIEISSRRRSVASGIFPFISIFTMFLEIKWNRVMWKTYEDGLCLYREI
jgi:hypothetical protein